MRILRHVWAIVIDLVALVVVIGMFSVADTKFETIVVGALTIIHMNVVASVALLSRSDAERAQGVAAFLTRIARLLNDPEAGDYERELETVTREFEATTMRYYIHGCFRFIIWMIAIVNLVEAAL